jgi:hypothetical protein
MGVPPVTDVQDSLRNLFILVNNVAGTSVTATLIIDSRI